MWRCQVYAAVLLKAGTIPKTSSGKIQRRATRAEFLAGTLDALGSCTLNSDAAVPAESNLSRKTLLAISKTERQPLLESYLQELVRRVLQLEQYPEIHQPLSRFGLDSLKVIELKNQIELDFGVAVPVADFFEGASVAQLAAEILSQLAEATALPAIEPVGRNSNLPLSFAQERLWFFDPIQPGSPLYNLSAQLRLAGRLNVAALSHSFHEIIRRHETLRTNFVTEGGKPVQVIAPARPFNLPVTDLSELSESERLAELHRLSAAEAISPFDLAKDSLLRAKLLRLAEAEHVLLVTAHHIVFDGWSLSVFLRDLAEVYQAFDTGNLPLLPALPVAQILPFGRNRHYRES